MPFGAAKIQERQVGLFLLQRVGIDAKRDLRARMAELARDPGDALARRESEACEGVASVVETEWPNAFLLGFPAKPIPAPADIAFVERTTGLGAEDERRWLLPTALQRGLLALFEEIVKHAAEVVRHHDEARAAAFRGE